MLYPTFSAKLQQNHPVYKISWRDDETHHSKETCDLTEALKLWFDLLTNLASTHYLEDQLMTYVWHEANSNNINYLLTHHQLIGVYYKDSDEVIKGPSLAKDLDWSAINAFLIVG